MLATHTRGHHHQLFGSIGQEEAAGEDQSRSKVVLSRSVSQTARQIKRRRVGDRQEKVRKGEKRWE